MSNSIYKNTTRYLELSELELLPGEIIVAPRNGIEPRSQGEYLRRASENGIPLIWVDNICRDAANFALEGGDSRRIWLTNLRELLDWLSPSRLLLDLSGLPHNVWAPLLKTCYESSLGTRVLYSEPESYSLHDSPASSALFDLTKEFEGLSPLPGFAQLEGPEDESKSILVTMLGFEGNRPARIAYQLDPAPKVIPIVGVPGFQAEFPTYALSSNRELLKDFDAHGNLRYSMASCPFEIFEELGRIRKDYPDFYMYIAPVGTRPHGLGAILYAIAYPDNTEILFDHPIKKPGRTKGVGVTHIYNFETFDEFRP